MKGNKQEIFTVRADAALLEAMKGVPNRSEFVRQAILAALENTCPMCKGTGILAPNQKKHWDEFLTDHDIVQCDTCQDIRLKCQHRTPEEEAAATATVDASNS